MGEIKEFNREELLGYIDDVDVINTSARATIYRGSATGDIVAISIVVKEYTFHDHWLAEKDCLTLCEHQNIIKLLGWANTGDKQYLMFPYYPRGSLQSDTGDLRQQVTTIRGVASAMQYLQSLGYIHGNLQAKSILVGEVTTIRGVAAAMQYLQSLGYIHGNLQAKSILVGKDNAPVLCGFGSVLRIGSELPEALGYTLGYTNKLIVKVCPELQIMSFGVMTLQLVMKVTAPYINGQSILHLATNGINFERQKYVCPPSSTTNFCLPLMSCNGQFSRCLTYAHPTIIYVYN